MGKPSTSPVGIHPLRPFPDWNKFLIVILLLLGSAQAIFYVFFIPPWYHHDEPSHLEYVMLVARLGRIPEKDERQQDIADAIGRSMIETGFSSRMGSMPDLNPQPGQVTQLGFSQLGGPALYYLLAAIPVRLYNGQDILVPLHLARIVSALFYLLNIFAAWGLAKELFRTPRKDGQTSGGFHFMHLALPAFLALWPAHLDIMTAVNTDSPAIAFAGLSLWGVVRILRVAFSEHQMAWGGLAGAVLFAVFAMAFKETAVVILPAVILGLSFAIPQLWQDPTRKPFNLIVRRGLPWILILAGLAVAGFLLLRFDDAAYWIRLSDQPAPVRSVSRVAPDGSFVGKISLDAQRFPPWHVNIFQPLAHDRMPDEFPTTFSFGAWIWADEPLETAMPAFAVGPTTFTRPVFLTTEPQFFAYSFTLEAYSAPTLRIQLSPGNIPGSALNIYMDGLVLAQGSYSLQTAPEFSDLTASSGVWDGKQFTNLIRNGSFEQRGIRFAPRLDSKLAPFIPDQSLPSAWLQASLDWEGLSYYYWDTGAHLFRTFWARFGWGNIALVPTFPVIGAYPYRKIGYLCIFLVGLTFLIPGMQRLISRGTANRTHYPAIVELIFIFALTIGLAWGMTLLRGSLYTGTVKIFYPVARYALPSILPTLLLLLSGWGVLTEALQNRFPRTRWISFIIFLCLLIFLNSLSLASILSYVTR